MSSTGSIGAANTEMQIAVALLRKGQDVAKSQGEAVVSMLQDVAAMQKQAVAQTQASVTGVGRALDVTG